MADATEASNQGRLSTLRKELVGYVMRETKRLILIPLPADVQPFLRSQLLGPAVAKALPLAADDIQHAGECIALGLHTAAVFHLMRVMEFALRALTDKLGIPDPVGGDRTWAKMIKGVRDAIDSRQWKAGERAPYDTAVGFLDTVRVAWRNPVMHVEAKHDKDDARRIFNAVETFTHQLADVIG